MLAHAWNVTGSISAPSTSVSSPNSQFSSPFPFLYSAGLSSIHFFIFFFLNWCFLDICKGGIHCARVAGVQSVIFQLHPAVSPLSCPSSFSSLPSFYSINLPPIFIGSPLFPLSHFPLCWFLVPFISFSI